MSIWKNGIMGVVVGDTLGCPVQFESRAEVARHPVTGMWGFEGCESLESVKLPGGLKELGEYAFFLCDKLSSISIPEGVTRIETGTFFGCSRLRHVDIPGTVISLGKEAFMNCDSLRSITIPEGVEEIEESAFRGCSKMEKSGHPRERKAHWRKRVQRL